LSFAEIFGITDELSCGVACVILRLAVSVEHRLVTDRRTDGQTDKHTTAANTRASYSAGKNGGRLFG